MQNIVKKNQFAAPVTTIMSVDRDRENQKKYEAMQTLRDSGMTAGEIGNLFGVCKLTVYNHTHTPHDYMQKHMDAMAEAHRMRAKARRGYYIPLMQELRNLGYNNRDIAEKTGFSLATVWNYIGKQPDEISLASHRIAGAKIRFRNLAVRNQIARDNDEPIPAVAEVLKTA